jgi:hypothetical protein
VYDAKRVVRLGSITFLGYDLHSLSNKLFYISVLLIRSLLKLQVLYRKFSYCTQKSNMKVKSRRPSLQVTVTLADKYHSHIWS